MTSYQALLAAKLAGVLLFAAGLGGGLLCSDQRERKRAVHNVASPGLALTWGLGYLLAWMRNIPWMELWLVGGLGFSLIAHLVAIEAVSRDRPPTLARGLACAVPLILTLILMLVRPTWSPR